LIFATVTHSALISLAVSRVIERAALPFQRVPQLVHISVVNAQTAAGWRPLHDAAHNGHAQVVTTLVELGAIVEAR
jgi:hypothetical protein